MHDDDQPSDPFADFINASLDMNGINGLEQTVVAAQVNRILHTLPSRVTPDLWNDQLDDLQAVIRVCLDLQTVLGAFEEHLDPTSFSHDDLENLIMLSVTFAFISHNQLRQSYDADRVCNNDNSLMARRLRDSLQATLGWVEYAAEQGDPIARKLVDELKALLASAKRLDEDQSA